MQLNLSALQPPSEQRNGIDRVQPKSIPSISLISLPGSEISVLLSVMIIFIPPATENAFGTQSIGDSPHTPVEHMNGLLPVQETFLDSVHSSIDLTQKPFPQRMGETIGHKSALLQSLEISPVTFLAQDLSGQRNSNGSLQDGSTLHRVASPAQEPSAQRNGVCFGHSMNG